MREWVALRHVEWRSQSLVGEIVAHPCPPLLVLTILDQLLVELRRKLVDVNASPNTCSRVVALVRELLIVWTFSIR
jgi:hypothetical protein